MNTYVQKIEKKDFLKVKEFFQNKGAKFEQLQYAEFKTKLSNCNGALYSSGKFVLQGKEISSIVNEFEIFLGLSSISSEIIATQKSLIKSTKTTSTCAYSSYIGTDESGKGDFFGALVIAGVMIEDSNRQKFLDLGVKDSKKLNDKVIKHLAAEIKNNSVFSIVTIKPEKYNELYWKFKNLNKLLAWGHARAIENILNKQHCEYALSDQFGDESLIKNALMNAGQKIILEQRHRAESDIAVAAASVVARAEFVIRMEEMEKYFGMEFSKGASTSVKEQAREFCKKYGKESLNKIAKLHFKTTQEI